MLAIIQKFLLTQPTTESLKQILEFAESRRIEVPRLSSEKCDGCEECGGTCPTAVFQFRERENKRSLVIRGEKCIRCNRCIEQCEKSAISYGFRLPVASRNKRSFRQEYVWENNRFLLQDPPNGSADSESIHLEALGDLLNRSFAFREVDSGSCNGCEVEVNMLSSTYYDVERFGITSTASPRFADAILISGPVSRNMQQACVRTYDAVPTPKLVIALGSCSISGGIYEGSYATNDGADSVAPVDVYIPGCPPSPQAIIYGFLLASRRIPPSPSGT